MSTPKPAAFNSLASSTCHLRSESSYKNRTPEKSVGSSTSTEKETKFKDDILAGTKAIGLQRVTCESALVVAGQQDDSEPRVGVVSNFSIMVGPCLGCALRVVTGTFCGL